MDFLSAWVFSPSLCRNSPSQRVPWLRDWLFLAASSCHHRCYARPCFFSQLESHSSLADGSDLGSVQPYCEPLFFPVGFCSYRVPPPHAFIVCGASSLEAILAWSFEAAHPVSGASVFESSPALRPQSRQVLSLQPVRTHPSPF